MASRLEGLGVRDLGASKIGLIYLRIDFKELKASGRFVLL